MRWIDDFIEWIPPASNRLAWRYIARNTYNGGYWVMVRDTWREVGKGNWGFVPLSCMSSPMTVAPGHTPYWP